MPWSCNNCGHEANDDEVAQCVACGDFRMATGVSLSGSTGESLSMRISTTLGRSLLKRVAGDDSQFASTPQCEIVKDSAAGCWMLRHAETATNPTFLDGNAVTKDTLLTTGCVLTIGPEKMPVTISLEY